MNKKIILGLSLVVIAVMAIGAVSAFDLGSLLGGSENQTVTIDGIDFNVPEGYVEVEDQAIINETQVQGPITYTTNCKVYGKDSTEVALLVGNYGEYNVTDDVVAGLGGEAKTIKNVKGYMDHDDEYYVFSYAKDNKLAVISTNDESAIADFIIE